MEKILVTRSLLPSFDEYMEKIRPLWESHWLTNMGMYHKELEEELKKYFDVHNVSLMVNGHMALELAIQMMDFPRGSEVITTPFTFISTTHAIIRNGLTPVFCDIKEDNYTIDESKLEDLITEKTVAIVPVHVYGNICNIEEIEKIAYKYNLKVIYDAAHAFGESYKGKGIGGFGDASTFSFHATKVFNTIEGGAVCFKDEKYYEKLYNLKNFGIRSEELVTEVGANAKMNEFEAAMGLCNLKIVDQEIQRRKSIAERYLDNLRGVKGLRFNDFNRKEEKRNYAYFPIMCDENEFGSLRDELYEKLKQKNIYSRKYFYPLTSDQACFKNKWKNVDLPIARKYSNQVLVLPMYGDLSKEQVDYICNIIYSCKKDK